MTVADTYFVGTLGTAELAGVGMANTILWATICFSMGLLRAVKVMVAQGIVLAIPTPASAVPTFPTKQVSFGYHPSYVRASLAMEAEPEH